MLIAIAIIAYIIWICDIVMHISEGSSNLLFSATLIVLISWHIDTTWGIVMTPISVIIFFIMVLGFRKKK